MAEGDSVEQVSNQLSEVSLSQFKWNPSGDKNRFPGMPTKRVFATPVDVGGTLYVVGMK